MPGIPSETRLGLAWAAFTTSPSDLKGESGSTTKTLGEEATGPTGLKSLKVS